MPVKERTPKERRHQLTHEQELSLRYGDLPGRPAFASDEACREAGSTIVTADWQMPAPPRAGLVALRNADPLAWPRPRALDVVSGQPLERGRGQRAGGLVARGIREGAGTRLHVLPRPRKFSARRRGNAQHSRGRTSRPAAGQAMVEGLEQAAANPCCLNKQEKPPAQSHRPGGKEGCSTAYLQSRGRRFSRKVKSTRPSPWSPFISPAA